MSEDLKRHMSSVVRAARRRAGITQEELATRIGRTPESVSNIERGVQSPTIETLAELGRVLDLPIPAFFDLNEGRKLSPERIRLEVELREIARALNDRDLAIAVTQAAAFLRHSSTTEKR